MKSMFARLWKEECGVLSFEWITLNSVVVLGVVGGLAAVRDAINDEMADMTEAMTSLDQSYQIAAPLSVMVHPSNNSSGSTGQGNQFQSQISEGNGYSNRAWQQFLTSHPDFANAQSGRNVVSGGIGSSFIDTKPGIDRSVVPTAPVMDESGLIENNQ